MSIESNYSMLIAGSAFIAMACLACIVFVFAGFRNGSVDRRVKSLRSDGSSNRSSARRRQRNTGNKDTHRGPSDGLTERIVQAGLYKKGSMALYSAIRVVLMTGPIVMGVVVGQLGLVSPTLGLVYGLLAGVVGTVAPSFWLDYKKAKRQTQIRRALPDALDVIVTCVDAGLSLPAAISRVSAELRSAHPMLAVEMAICQREIQLGASTGTALRRFSQRFDLEELRSMASVIQQAEKFGASITNALRVHAGSLREKRFQIAEERAQRAAVKIVFPTILCIFPALFIVLAGPAVTRIFQMFDTMAQQ